MSIFRRPTRKHPNRNHILSALACPECTWRDANNPIKLRDTYILHGGLGADLHWRCRNCRTDVYVPVDAGRYRTLSDAWTVIRILDDEMTSPVRRNVGPPAIHNPDIPHAVAAALSIYGTTSEPEHVAAWIATHRKGQPLNA